MVTTSLPQHHGFVRWLRLSLVLGALYDVIFAAIMVLAPELPAKQLQLPMPGEAFYLWLMAVFLCMLAAVYLFAAYDPIAYRGNVLVAIVGRSAGALVFCLAAWGRPELAGLYVVAFADLAFALMHALAWWPIRQPGHFRLPGR